MSNIEKLITKALKNPQNLLFKEFCRLCEYFGMEKRRCKGSHVIYKRKKDPKFTLPIQNADGKAIPYQVKQLIEKVREFKLYDFEEEK